MLYKPKKKSFTYWLWCSTWYTIRVIDLKIESQSFSIATSTRFFHEVKLSKHIPYIRRVRIRAPSTNYLSSFDNLYQARDFRYVIAPNPAFSFVTDTKLWTVSAIFAGKSLTPSIGTNSNSYYRKKKNSDKNIE